MRIVESVLAALQRRMRRNPEPSSQTFDDFLTDATHRAPNPSASDLVLLEECFRAEGQGDPVAPTKPSTKHGTRRRKIA